MFGWDDARFFLEIHRAGSLSAAGRKLRVNQSTVSRRLAALESALGARLFDRTPDGYLLTPAGEALLPRAERMEDEAIAAARDVAGGESRLVGTVRLTAPETFGSRFLTARLADFHQRYPDITLELVADNRAFSLSRREADVALRLDRPTQPLLVTRQVAEVGTTLYAAKAYLSTRGKPRSSDFTGHDLIGFDETFQPEAEVRWLAQRTRGARVVFKSNSPQSQLAAAEAGMGLALLPCYLAEPVPGLVQVLPVSEGVVRGLWLVLHRDLRQTARVRALTEFLTQLLRREHARLRGGSGV
ncbi:LysR family transcriptional regulator [Vitiosangium sp. GDMCC 1.1324]|uniref:LysR family transcriptional regulator n=1 Tax=Vitiosangium sp. (strain GDMCC 1.1324) TaxID=2138576 RepID=UPI000D34F09A|nr:LysR family transcriptional regulator [Vitiosangium sp. GDMCC 1.1324]PTL82818.1 LysR family transcriptional regulator [Vitiosangium sp. GDMCC 1.1324]